jgi:hypothetical protein
LASSLLTWLSPSKSILWIFFVTLVWSSVILLLLLCPVIIGYLIFILLLSHLMMLLSTATLLVVFSIWQTHIRIYLMHLTVFSVSSCPSRYPFLSCEAHLALCPFNRFLWLLSAFSDAD